MRILVVDDDRMIVKTTCDILTLKGHQTEMAFSGEEGVEKVRATPFDCVVMDLKMPGINGVEALKRMKEIAPSLPVVLASAYATEDLIKEAKIVGAYAVLTKPYNFQTVLSFMALLSKEETILVVDDDPLFCRTLADALTVRGFHVETETDPGKVLGRLESNYKLVVLLDLQLGTVNGLQVLRQVRSRYPGKPVVLITGHGQEMADTIEEGLQAGAHACLFKPFELDRLAQMINDIRLDKLRNLLVAA